MMHAQTLPRSEWSVSLLLIPTWIAFANVVSLSGALLWVIVPSLIAVQTMFVMIAADRRMVAGIVLFFLTLLSGTLAELIGGQTSGSITRATLMMTSCAGLMALLWRTRFPATSALVSLAALAGALGLGAADRIVWLVGVWVVAMVAYLAAVGPLRSSDLADHGRLKSLVAILLTAGLVGSVAGNVMGHLLQDPWTIRSVGPKALGAIIDTRSSSTTANATQTGVSDVVRGFAGGMRTPGRSPRDAGVLNKHGKVAGSEKGMSVPKTPKGASEGGTTYAGEASLPRSWLEIVGLVVLVLLVILVLSLTLWVAWVQIKWLKLRARLHRGSPAEQVAGAWHWLRLRWAQSGYFEYANLTPDRIAHLAATQGDPVLEDLASAATEALYARQPELDAMHVARAWQNSKTLQARVVGTWPNRLRSCLITPAAANKRESEHRSNVSSRSAERSILQ